MLGGTQARWRGTVGSRPKFVRNVTKAGGCRAYALHSVRDRPHREPNQRVSSRIREIAMKRCEPLATTRVRNGVGRQLGNDTCKLPKVEIQETVRQQKVRTYDTSGQQFRSVMQVSNAGQQCRSAMQVTNIGSVRPVKLGLHHQRGPAEFGAVR